MNILGNKHEKLKFGCNLNPLPMRYRGIRLIPYSLESKHGTTLCSRFDFEGPKVVIESDTSWNSEVRFSLLNDVNADHKMHAPIHALKFSSYFTCFNDIC